MSSSSSSFNSAAGMAGTKGGNFRSGRSILVSCAHPHQR